MARTRDLEHLRDDVRDRADLPPSSANNARWSDERLTRYINQAAQRYVVMACEAGHERWLKRTTRTTSVSSTAVASGWAPRDLLFLPDDFYQLRGIDITAAGSTASMMPFEREERNLFQDYPAWWTWWTNGGTGVPIFYRLGGMSGETSTVTAEFTNPDWVDPANVTIEVSTTSWMTVSDEVTIEGGGRYEVSAIVDETHVTLVEASPGSAPAAVVVPALAIVAEGAERPIVQVIPAARGVYTCTIWYVPVLPDLVNDADTFDGDAGFEEYIVNRAAMDCRTKDALTDGTYGAIARDVERLEKDLKHGIAGRAPAGRRIDTRGMRERLLAFSRGYWR